MIPNLPRDFPRTGNVMPEFQETLLGLGPICDSGCTVLFSDTDVIVHDKGGKPILSGWRDTESARLWYFNLLPEEEELPPPQPLNPVTKPVSPPSAPTTSPVSRRWYIISTQRQGSP